MWLNVVPLELPNGKWTMAEGTDRVLFALEYDTEEEAWQAIAEEEENDFREQHGQHTDEVLC